MNDNFLHNIILTLRRKMFEKNKSIPTPIARFGESVTPAMIAANAKPNQAPITEAWKRKRYFILQEVMILKNNYEINAPIGYYLGKMLLLLLPLFSTLFFSQTSLLLLQ